jgi:SAM-dependent methyltransferase
MYHDLHNKFLALVERDRNKFIEEYMINWDYIDRTRKRGRKAENVDAAEFFEFRGKEDFITWFNWLQYDQPNYFGEEFVHELVQESLGTDKHIFEKLGLAYNFSKYPKNIGSDNALDFKIPFLYPSPSRYSIKRVLDFGAGYGRQANLWSRPAENYTYIAMDAIPKSYCLQHLYFSNLERPYKDYWDSPDNFKLDLDWKGIYHVPTWRHDLVPENSIDLIICIQVLPELSTALVSKMVKEFYRFLKPGGMLYIRDNKEKWVPAGKINKERLLSKTGFIKEYEAHIINRGDLHGIPRIWRKPDPLVMEAQTRNSNEIFRQNLNDLDAMTGGYLSRVAKMLKQK